MTSKAMVVARYKEDVSWIDTALGLDLFDAVEVYNKGPVGLSHGDPRVRIRNVSNVGREGGTYLDYIIGNYEKLPEEIWFTQADPFDHSPDFIGLLKGSQAYRNKPFQSLTLKFKYAPPRHLIQSHDAFDLNGNRCSHYFVKAMQVVGHCGFFDDGSEMMLDKFEAHYGTRDSFGYLADRIGIARPRPITEFAYGACFYTRGSCVSRHPRWVYERARDFLLEVDEQGEFQGFILERFWPYLVSGSSYETLTDAYRSFFEGRSVSVYCDARKAVWTKAPGCIVISRPEVTAIVHGPDGVRRLPGVDLVGEDLSVSGAKSLQEAVGIVVSKNKGESR